MINRKCTAITETTQINAYLQLKLFHYHFTFTDFAVSCQLVVEVTFCSCKKLSFAELIHLNS